MRRPLILCLLLLLPACGFTPLYGTPGGQPGQVQAELADIWIEPMADRLGQMLRNALTDRLAPGGTSDAPRWRLVMQGLTEQQIDLGIRRDATATRAQIRLNAAAVLIDRTSNQAVYQARVRAISSYNILDSEFATRVSERDARERAVALLAEQVETRLALHFRRDDPGKAR